MQCSDAWAQTKPNIVFVLSDDVAQGDLGCYGQKLIKTPNIDRMADEGTRYMTAYCGTTVCAPSRASLMTGLHGGHCPIRGNFEVPPEGQLPLPENTPTVASILKQAGYSTACIGKWGMGGIDTTGDPLNLGFDHFFGYNCQREAHSYFPKYLYDDREKIVLEGNDGKNIGKTYSQNLIQNEALRWIDANKGNPFFLYYAITLPHGRHEIDSLGEYADQPWTLTQKSYAAQVSRLDRDLGEILDRLRELHLEQNTLVLFAGDNGSSFSPESDLGKLFEQSVNGLRGYKRELYEGGLRQAAIAWWPGKVPSKRVTDEPWAFWDFLPTAADLAGISTPLTTDGFSLVSFLEGGQAPNRDFFYWELHEGAPTQAIRWGDWKGVRPNRNQPLELYDLSEDPSERNNVAAENKDVVEKLEAWMSSARTDDPMWPLTGKPSFRVESEMNAWKATQERLEN
jgi:arylsulfatase A-like enzyme